jgi:DNA helicase-2/ATP-dependent DNA helicase PcrA
MRPVSRLSGPAAFGRGVIVAPDAPAPEPWADAPRVLVDDAALRTPRETVDRLHELWSTRTPVTIDLRVPREVLSAPERDDRPAYECIPGFDFARERCYFLVRANNYDARDGSLRWGPAIEAERLGARIGGSADVLLSDGTSAWCDGGPRGSGVDTAGRVVHRIAIESGQLRADLEPSESAEAAGLASDQRAAVHHGGGPARILAPAGSGKTTVLAARFRHLVVERGYGAASVCALAYNRRAGADMQDRLADLPRDVRHKVRTLNAFGYEIVRRAQPNTRVIDEREIRDRIQPHLTLRLRANTDALRPYLEALEEVSLGLRTPERVEQARGDVDGFAVMYRHYRDGLARDDAVDFDGQVASAIETLLRDPALRRTVQRECRHLLVDEFQDLRPAHLLLVRLVSAPAYDVFGVGDDDQVIYGYSGADPDFLINFDTFFPGAADHPLEVNYRCPPLVVDGARMLLSHNRRRVVKVMRAGRGVSETDADAVVVERPSGETIAPRATDLIDGWLRDGVAPEAIAVLCRVNAGLLAVQVLAHDRGLPVTAAVGEQFLRRTGVRSALSYVRLACAVSDGAQLRGVDLAEVARRPNRRITARVVDALRNRRTWTLHTLRAHADALGSADTERLQGFADDLDSLGAIVESGDAATVLRAVRDDVGLGAAMGTLDNSGRGRDASHLDDVTALLAIAAVHPDPATFETWLRDHLQGISVGDDPCAAGQVTLSTVHRVKGLEWDRVIVLGAHDGLLPHRLADDREEERRVFHVALTRCRERVVLLADVASAASFVDELTTPAAPITAETRLERSRRTAPTGSFVAGETGDADASLFDALRAWRLERCRADGVPAYVVLHDATLNDIAAARPVTSRDLARIAGIGPTKLERYAEDILAVVNASQADANELPHQRRPAHN